MEINKCNNCFHRKVCINSANYKNAEDCRLYVYEKDVQEVKRCKDCKYRHSSEFCECREPDAYCSDGARMDGDTNT